jgi:hypothetical protein
MSKFLLVYYDGKMAADPKEMAKANADWTNWFNSMGKKMVDMGTPAMPGKMVSSAGVGPARDGAAITGYSVITAENLDAALKMAKGAPGMDKGLKVAVFPTMDMMAMIPPSRQLATL